MSGAFVVRQQLVAAPAVTVIAPPDQEISRIVAGLLEEGADLPALAIRVVRSDERKTINTGAMRHMTDLVQIMAVVERDDELPPLTQAIRSACTRFPTYEGFTRVVVLPAGEEEVFTEEGSKLLMKPHNFTVSYNEPR